MNGAIDDFSEAIVSPLLEWYDRHRRILPWRETPTPYRVWISEIMLQQTRVEAVKPYYERFLTELPDIAALAEVEDDRLMKLWEGLGYYARARSLKNAARMVVYELNGRFPDTVTGLLALPGIGEYTAGAVASIAYGLPEPAVDGNVLRVLARLTACGDEIGQPAVRKRAADALRRVYPAGRAADFTQALMELGAIICLPNGAPLCDRCPWRPQCRAYRENSQSRLPVKTAPRARRREQRTVLLLRSGDHAAFGKRPARGLLAGMWELINLDGEWNRDALSQWLAEQGLDPLCVEPGPDSIHIFTHKEWHMRSWRVECGAMPPCLVWVKRSVFETEMALPTAFKPFLAALWS